jgi:hypothetical protein
MRPTKLLMVMWGKNILGGKKVSSLIINKQKGQGWSESILWILSRVSTEVEELVSWK